MKTRQCSEYSFALSSIDALTIKTYFQSFFTEVFLTSRIVLYCVKGSLHKRSWIKLFTQAHWSHAQSHAIMDFCNLW